MATRDSSRRVEKRNRPPVSCEPCRSRKLKCNRDLPCDACVRRKRSALCHYADNASRNKPVSSVPRDLKDRLKNLENVVSSFLSGEPVTPNPTYLDEGATTNHNERLMVQSDSLTKPNPVSASEGKGEFVLTPEPLHLQETSDGQVNYIDPGHWQAILEDIREVRDHLSVLSQSPPQDDPTIEVNHADSDPSLIFGAVPCADLTEILSSLPTQPICNMLLSAYFNSRFMVLGFVHPVKFQGEYEAFCESPSTAPLPWIALLFSILSIMAAVRRMSNAPDPEGTIPTPRVLQQRTIQCLVLGRYDMANTHALEALMIHLQSCFVSHDHRTVNLWFEMGTIIRLAFRLAYNRDPSNLAGVSPFDGEMRRRVWLNIVQVDALMSFQLGFPSMIPSEYCDAQTPRNLEHSDLDVAMTTLPPARPLSEPTPVRYTIVKNGIMSVFKKIVAYTQSLSPPAYDKAMALDVEMKQAYIKVPDVLKRRDVNRSFMDASDLIWERCTVEILYLKGLIVLHRRYISYELQSPIFAPSRRACVEAALDILARMEDLHKACEPGGRLYDEKWMFYTVPIQDFLLAATVVCLDLSVRMRFSATNPHDEQGHQDLTAKEHRVLESSLEIWTAKYSKSPEASIAALAIGVMLKKVTGEEVEPPVPEFALPTDTTQDFDSRQSCACSIASMMDGSEDIDWGVLDQYFLTMDSSNTEFNFQ